MLFLHVAIAYINWGCHNLNSPVDRTYMGPTMLEGKIISRLPAVGRVFHHFYFILYHSATNGMITPFKWSKNFPLYSSHASLALLHDGDEKSDNGSHICK